MTFDAKQKLTRDNVSELPVLCTDGAWGTEMDRHGAAPGELCDLWNVDHPERVEAVAKAYVDAGAQVILSNTFNSNGPTLERHGMAARVAELCREGARISKKAAQGTAYVFASMGPTGKMVMMGEVTPEAVEATAAEQAAAFEEGGADAIVIETQSDLMEAEALLKGALGACSIPVGISFSFDSGPNKDMTMMGATIDQAAELAVRLGASFVGANCGAGIDTFPSLVEAYKATGASLPIWVKGNAGLPEVDEQGATVFRAPPALYAEVGPKLAALGAKFVGGCCGSTPAHIQALRSALDAR